MTYVKFNINAELRKFLRNKPMKTVPAVLLTLLASAHLDDLAKAEARHLAKANPKAA